MWVAGGLAGILLGGMGTAALAAGTAPPAAAPAAVGAPRPIAVVVVGVPGLRWDDVTARSTPTLWRLAGGGAVGSLSVRSVREVTCPADGWLTLGAGNRARGSVAPSARCAIRPPAPVGRADGGPAGVPGFDSLARDNRRLAYGTEPGALADAVRRTGGCVAALGPDAALAAAGREGRVDSYAAGTAFAAGYTRCEVTLVGLPALSGGDRTAAASAADAMLAGVDGARPTGSELLVVGISETGGGPARLHVAIAVGGRYQVGRLVSASTGRAPLVQLVDVAPTVLRDLGRSQPAVMTGAPWSTTAGGPGNPAARVGALVDGDRAAVAQRRLTAPFFEVLVAGQLALYPLLAFAVLRAPPGSRRRRVRQLLQVSSLACASALVASFLANLVPWWRAGRPAVALLAALLVADALVVTVALAGPWRRTPAGPPATVAGLTAGVLGLDLLTGAPLQLSSLAGYSPLVAGRFAGMGNIGFGIFGTAAVLLAALLAAGRSRREALATVSVIGAAAVVLDGAPLLGSDAGGVLALVPAFGLLGMLVAGVRLGAVRLAGTAVAGIGVGIAFALLDYARPPDAQTHLGRFAGDVLHGGAGTVVRRKAAATLGTLTTGALTLLVPVAVAIVAGVLARPPAWLRAAFGRAPTLRAGLVATLVMGVVAALVNDSGVIIPAVAMTLAVPLTLAVSASDSKRADVTVGFRGRADRPTHQTH